MSLIEAVVIDTAYHEAGHACIGTLLGRWPLIVDIIPDGNGRVGLTEFENDLPPGAKKYFNETPEQRHYLEKRILITVAGTAAHNLKFPGRLSDLGDQIDENRAQELIKETVIWADNPERHLSELKAKAALLLKENWKFVEAVAVALVVRKKLTRKDLVEIQRTAATKLIVPE